MNSPSLQTLSSWEDVPVFFSLEHERAFWQLNQIGPLLLHTSLGRADTQEASLLQLRMDPRFFSRLKRLSRQRYTDLPSMIRLWLVERLERETAETSPRSEQPNQSSSEIERPTEITHQTVGWDNEQTAAETTVPVVQDDYAEQDAAKTQRLRTEPDRLEDE